MTQKYYQGDVGTEVRVNTCVDLAGAISMAIRVKKPTSLATWSGVAALETSDEVAARRAVLPTSSSTPMLSVISHIAGASDFSEAGIYKIQSSIVTPAGSWRGNTATFTVSPEWAM